MSSSYFFLDGEDESFVYPVSFELFIPNHDSLIVNKWQLSESELLKSLVVKNTIDDVIHWDIISGGIKNRQQVECLMRYRNVINESINKSEWTLDEEKNLLVLVEKYCQRCWFNIAFELDTNRTPLDCFLHYQRVLNPDLVKVKWTDEEDKLLKDAFSKYGAKNWLAIANCIPGRSAYQCKVRSRQSLLFTEALEKEWSAQEERLLMLALAAYEIPSVMNSKSSVTHDHRDTNEKNTTTLANNKVRNI